MPRLHYKDPADGIWKPLSGAGPAGPQGAPGAPGAQGPAGPTVPMHLSGPHGALERYETCHHIIPAATAFSSQLHHTSPIAGWSRLTVSGYLQIQDIHLLALPSLTIFMTPYGRWHDGTAVNWANAGQTSVEVARLTLVKSTGGATYAYKDATAVRWFQSRPGARGSFGAQFSIDNDYGAAATRAYFGYQRVTIECHPDVQVAADGAAWGIP